MRTIQEATAITKNKGENHYGFGKTKATSVVYKNHSKRMSNKNPMHSRKSLKNAAITRAEYFKENPWPQEIQFENILKKLCSDYSQQYPIDGYIIDFYIPNKKLCVEIDSTNHWGKERRLAAEKKDARLIAQGYKILRINKTLLDNTVKILELLSAAGIS